MIKVNEIGLVEVVACDDVVIFGPVADSRIVLVVTEREPNDVSVISVVACAIIISVVVFSFVATIKFVALFPISGSIGVADVNKFASVRIVIFGDIDVTGVFVVVPDIAAVIDEEVASALFALVVACNVVLKGVRDILVIAADDDLVLFSSNFIIGVAVAEKLLAGKAVVGGAADTVTVVVDLVNVLTVDERIAVVLIAAVVTCVSINSGIIIISVVVVVVDIAVVFNLDEFLVAEVADSGCFVILTPAFVARLVFVIDGNLVVE